MEKLRIVKSVRPKLYTISPFTSLICWGFAIVNILMGLGMFFLYHTTIELSVANIFSYQIWGVLFFLGGVASGFSLVRNDWKTTRQLLMYGLALKSIWAIALLIRCVAAPQTILITVIWLWLVYVQAITYIYFLPKGSEYRKIIQ